MQSEISERFHALVDIPESQIGLAEGALVLAAEVRPELDIELGLSSVTQLVERTRPLIDSARTPSGRSPHSTMHSSNSSAFAATPSNTTTRATATSMRSFRVTAGCPSRSRSSMSKSRANSDSKRTASASPDIFSQRS